MILVAAEVLHGGFTRVLELQGLWLVCGRRTALKKAVAKHAMQKRKASITHRSLVCLGSWSSEGTAASFKAQLLATAVSFKFSVVLL